MKKYKIFIVEDNDLFSMVLEHNLRETFNFTSKNFSNGEECIEQLKNNPPDLILLDYSLKGMNGMETLKKIKSINSGIPVIIISSQNDLQTAIDLMNAGADDYIEKNNNPIQKLIKSIEKIQINNR